MPVSEVLGIHHEPDGVLVLTGCIDLATAPFLQRALAAARTPGSDEQVVDLRGVSYLDSHGLTVLFEHAPHVRLLVTSRSAVANVVRLSGLTTATAVDFLPAA